MPNVLPFRLPKSPLNDCTGTKRRILRHPCPPRPQNRLDPLRGRKPRSETRSPQESRRHPIEQHLRGEARREEGSPTCVNYAQVAARPRVREPILPAALRAAPSHLWEGGFCFLAPSYLPASRIGSRAWIMVHIFWERQTPKRSHLQLRAASLPLENRDHFFFFFFSLLHSLLPRRLRDDFSRAPRVDRIGTDRSPGTRVLVHAWPSKFARRGSELCTTLGENAA